MPTHFATLLAALGRQTGQEFVPDSHNACDLFFDDLPVTLQYLEADQCLLIYCAVGSIPEDGAERQTLYARLLRANFLFRETAGAALAADEDAKLVSLQQVFSMQALDETSFLDLLERYLHMAEHWRRICASPAPSPADAQQTPPPPPGTLFV